VQFMKQHLGSRPAIVVGPSLGGAAALDLALHHPELVRDSKGHEARWGGDGAQGTRRHSAAWLLAFSSLPACVWGSKHPLKGARGHELNGKGPSSLTSGCSPIVACVHSALPLIVAVLSARASLKSRGCQGGAELPPELCAGSAEGPGVVCQLSPPMPRQLPSCPSFPAFSAASPACVATRLQVAGLVLVDAQGYAEGIGGMASLPQWVAEAGVCACRHLSQILCLSTPLPWDQSHHPSFSVRCTDRVQHIERRAPLRGWLWHLPSLPLGFWRETSLTACPSAYAL